jgi:dihydroneopterin aldolase
VVMSRFVETTHTQKEVKKPQAPLPKAGSYTLKELEKAKPIYSGTGGKR